MRRPLISNRLQPVMNVNGANRRQLMLPGRRGEQMQQNGRIEPAGKRYSPGRRMTPGRKACKHRRFERHWTDQWSNPASMAAIGAIGLLAG
ncbi:hypothetical protein Pstr01_18410 [Pseudomonas straminea]|nr:hypothetical protein Pstr01_18410 [Pseudomonas straminea]